MVRRSGLLGRIVSSRRSAMRPAPPRARIMFDPPSEEPIRSGQRRAIHQLGAESWLREVSER